MKKDGAMLLFVTKIKGLAGEEFAHTFEKQTVEIGRCRETTRIQSESTSSIRAKPPIVSQKNNKRKITSREAAKAASRGSPKTAKSIKRPGDNLINK